MGSILHAGRVTPGSPSRLEPRLTVPLRCGPLLGVLNATAFMVELAGDFLRFLQTGNVRNYALTFLLGLVSLLVFVIGAI